MTATDGKRHLRLIILQKAPGDTIRLVLFLYDAPQIRR